MRSTRWLCCSVVSFSSFVAAGRPAHTGVAWASSSVLFSGRSVPIQLSPLRGGGARSVASMGGGKRDTRGDGMNGSLFQYKSQYASLQAFESGPLPTERKLVVLGGLSDGMMACPYVPELAQALAAEGWSVVQANLRSSYMQWGFGSLSEDVEDVTALLDYLVEKRGAKTLAVCGHSTGSQIIAHLMRTCPHDRVSHVIMQGGVSDRESDDAEETRTRSAALELAASICSSSSSGGQELMPRDTTWAPVTAQRYLDLNAVAGTDDYFSSDLSDEQLRERFGGFYSRTNVLMAYSAEDEYVAKSVDKPNLLRRLRAAMQGDGSSGSGSNGVVAVGKVPVIVPVLVPGGDHALYAQGSADAFIETAVAFLNDRPVAAALE